MKLWVTKNPVGWQHPCLSPTVCLITVLWYVFHVIWIMWNWDQSRVILVVVYDQAMTYDPVMTYACQLMSGVSIIINSLWPGDVIWWQWSGSTLALVIACCLTAPSHHLNQCWHLICQVLCHSILQQVPKLPFSIMTLKIIRLWLLPHLLGVNRHTWQWNPFTGMSTLLILLLVKFLLGICIAQLASDEQFHFSVLFLY